MSVKLALGGILLLALVAFSCRRSGRGPHTAPAPPKTPPPAPSPVREAVPEEGGEGTFALEDPFTGVVASRLATGSDRMIRALVFHGLTRLDPAGRAEPELAARWEMLRQGTEWIFHLRPDTAFTNGRYVEARHVVTSWERVISDAASPHARLLEAVKGFDEMRQSEAPHASGLVLEDGLTLRVVLKRPIRDLPTRLAHPALGISAFGEDEEGVGPFQIWSAPQPHRIILRSNPEYFRGLPHLDQITFVHGEAAQPANLDARSLDGAVLSPGEAISTGPATRLFVHSVPRTYLLGLNRSSPPFSRPELARAFLAGLDREELRRGVAGDGGRVPATLAAFLAPGRATEEPTERTAVRLPPLGRVELVVPHSDWIAAILAAAIQTDVARSGTRVWVHPVHPSDLGGVLARREYHLFVLPYLPASPSLLLEYEDLIPWNRSIPASLVAQVRGLEGETDPAALAAALAPLDTSLQLGGYLVPLVSLERRILLRRGLCGLRPDPVGSLDWTLVWRSRSHRGDCE